MRPAVKSDGTEYYEYILLYTDDVLCVSELPERILQKELDKYFKMKPNSIGPPKLYLGAGIRKVELENGAKGWAARPSQYVQEAAKNVERYLEKQEIPGRWKLPKKSETPLPTSYRPELDVTPELEPTEASFYASLIGMLRWIVELGRIEICLEVSMMSSHLALPREGHLQEVLHKFAHLKKYHNSELS